MKKFVLTLITAILFLGCSSKGASDESIVPKLVVSKTLAGLTLNDQHEKTHTLKASTKKVIFAFSKDVGHSCNDFFVTKDATYLESNSAIFIADVSGAPSLIRSMFIMPGLQEFKHRVLVLDNEDVAASYKAGVNSEKIIVVSVDNGIITDIKALDSTSDLTANLETK